jgi:hypothetical protein
MRRIRHQSPMTSLPLPLHFRSRALLRKGYINMKNYTNSSKPRAYSVIPHSTSAFTIAITTSLLMLACGNSSHKHYACKSSVSAESRANVSCGLQRLLKASMHRCCKGLRRLGAAKLRFTLSQIGLWRCRQSLACGTRHAVF